MEKILCSQIWWLKKGHDLDILLAVGRGCSEVARRWVGAGVLATAPPPPSCVSLQRNERESGFMGTPRQTCHLEIKNVDVWRRPVEPKPTGSWGLPHGSPGSTGPLCSRGCTWHLQTFHTVSTALPSSVQKEVRACCAGGGTGGRKFLWR